MKTGRNHIFIALCGLLLLSGCGKGKGSDANPGPGPAPGTKAINFMAYASDSHLSTTGKAIDSRTSISGVVTEFTDKDALGIFVLNADKSFGQSGALTDPAYEDVPYAYDADGVKWKPGLAAIYFPINSAKVDYYAYYPHSGMKSSGDQATVTDLTDPKKASFTLLTDQSLLADLGLCDLMVAVPVKGKTKNDINISLTMSHLLSMVEIKVVKGDTWHEGETPKIKTIEIKGPEVLPTVLFSVADGKLGDISGDETSVFHTYEEASELTATPNDNMVNLIVIPAPIAQTGNVMFHFVVEVAGKLNGQDWITTKEYTHYVKADNKFESNRKYQYAATVQRDRVDVDMVGISDWQTGGMISVDVKK